MRPDAPPDAAPDAAPEGASDAPAASDCDSAPAFPLSARRLPNVPASEDFTFDREGYLLAVVGGHSLVRVARGEAPVLFRPNVATNGRGLRVLSGGDVVLADLDRSLLLRVDVASGGDVRRLTTTIASPNAIELGPGGQLYVSDFGTTGDVFRVDPDSGVAVSIARPSIGSNGLTFSPDQSALYVGDHDTGVVYRVRFDATGAASPAEAWASGVGRPDGLATDSCGNVYAASWDHKLYQITPAAEVRVVADLGTVLSAVRFGSGKHGWDARSLYVMAIQQGGVYELAIDRQAAAPPTSL